MRLCELKQKEIINTCTCRSLGCPIDVEFDCITGRITALVVPGPGRFFLLFRERKRVCDPLEMYLPDWGRYYFSGDPGRKMFPQRETSVNLSRAFIFYIFLKKVYFSFSLRMIFSNKRLKEDVTMTLNKVEICGVNTSKLPVLKPEEKEELFRRIKEGDMEAREMYIKGNLRLVLSVIKRFQNSGGENADDLFSDRLYRAYEGH